ncbi:MAG: FHIPEP family type III secretion protein, partial [Candidatus Sericytochromatia bacterium]
MAAVGVEKGGKSIIADVSLAGLCMLVVVILMIPLPTDLIDLFLVLNLSVSVLILLTALNIIDPLELAIFPQLLLVTTLFRLAVNVATSRAILLNADAGHVVDTFANFVIGGNYVVGVVIFLILMVIQFIVITEGAKRVAEVAARFTLDAMPGKQMSIDADFNAGLIDAEEAKKRRRDLEKASNFFGTMDGANKFVRGDAIAGILITLINILGGFAIGVLMKGMELSEAASRYLTLSIGDGLVSIIPAFLISISAGFVTTRAISESNMAYDLKTQLLGNYRSLALSAVFMICFGFIPGMPKHFFWTLAGVLMLTAFIAYRKSVKKSQMVVEEEEDAVIPEQEVKKPENVLQVMEVHPLALEMGLDLIPLVDPSQGGDLLDRVV